MGGYFLIGYDEKTKEIGMESSDYEKLTKDHIYDVAKDYADNDIEFELDKFNEQKVILMSIKECKETVISCIKNEQIVNKKNQLTKKYYLEKNAYYIRTNKPETKIANTKELMKRLNEINETQNDTQTFYIKKMIKLTEIYLRFLGTLVDKDWIGKVYEKEVKSLEELIKTTQKCEPYNAYSSEICEILINSKVSWGEYIQDNCDVFYIESKRVIDNIKNVEIIENIDEVVNSIFIKHAIKEKYKQEFSYIVLLDYFEVIKKHALEVLSLLKYLIKLGENVKVNSMLLG